MPSAGHYDSPAEQLNPGSQLERDRNANDRRLKRRFERIFDKYSRDFEGIGDEIDIGTGDIVVDNGHLERMRHEVDAGDVASSRFVQAFASSLEHEDDAEDSEEIVDSEYATSYEDDADDGDGDLECDLESTGSQDLSNDGLGPSNESVSSRPGSPVLYDQPPVPKALLRRVPQRPAASLLQSGVIRRQGTKHDNSTHNALYLGLEKDRTGSRSASDIRTSGQQLPLVERSIQTLLQSPRKSGRIDSDAIQALGMSIAGQIAQFMQSASSSHSVEARQHQTKRKSRDPAWDCPELPQRKRRRATSIESTSMDPIPSSLDDLRRSFNEESIWALTPEPRSNKRPRKAGARISHTGLTISQNSEEEHFLPRSSSSTSEINATTSTVEFEYEREDEHTCSNCGTTRMLYSRWTAVGHICNACSVYLEQNSIGRDRTFQAASYQYRRMSESLPQPTCWTAQAFDAENAIDVTHPARGLHDDIYSTPHSDPRPVLYAANTARRITPSNHGHVNERRFTLQEDVLLLKLKHIKGLPWSDVGRHFTERTVQSLQHRYYSGDLNGIADEAYRTLRAQGYDIETSTVHGLQNRHAQDHKSKDEDGILVALRENDRLGWHTIAALLPGRSPGWAETRYNELRSGMDLASLLAERQAVAHSELPTQEIEEVLTATVNGTRKKDLPISSQQSQPRTKRVAVSPIEQHPVVQSKLPTQTIERVGTASVDNSHTNDSREACQQEYQPQKEGAAGKDSCGSKEKFRAYVKYSPEEEALISELRDKGVEWWEIGKHLGRSKKSLSTFWHWRTKGQGRTPRTHESLRGTSAPRDGDGADRVVSTGEAVDADAEAGISGDLEVAAPAYNLRQRSRGVAPQNYYCDPGDSLDHSDSEDETSAAPTLNREDGQTATHGHMPRHSNRNVDVSRFPTQSQHKSSATLPISDKDNNTQHLPRPAAEQAHMSSVPTRRLSEFGFQLTPAKVTAAFTPTRQRTNGAQTFRPAHTRASDSRPDHSASLLAESTKDIAAVSVVPARQPTSGERRSAGEVDGPQSFTPSSSTFSAAEQGSSNTSRSSIGRKQHSLWSGKTAAPAVTPAVKLRKHQGKRLSGSSLGSGSKRVVETPTRANMDPEDDELA